MTNSALIHFFFSVCLSAGLIASYYRRPMFPEYCSDATMDDKMTYNTMVRISGSFNSLALALQAIMHQYGWNRLALLSDMKVSTSATGTTSGGVCTYGCQAIINMFGSSVIPVYMKTSALTPGDYFDYLDTVRKNARSKHVSDYRLRKKLL
jgi:hypothetical protein